MGLWSLPPSWLSTVLDAILERSLIAKARSGVVLLSHRLEKKVGGSSGSFRRTRQAIVDLPVFYFLSSSVCFFITPCL